MENIDGSLGFKATLDINDFNVSAEAIERHIKRTASSVENEAEDMEQSILKFVQNGAKYIVSYLVGQGMGSLLQSIVSVRGQFQQLEIAFETMLGSGTKAHALMNQMAETAAKTPFDLQGVAGGAKQLLAYGESADKVNDTLVRLGNIASGLSIPLNDIVYLYGTTMVQGRLYAQDVRQFTGRGIPLVKELTAMYGKTAEEINAMVSEGKIGFPEVEKVLKKLTDQGGQFYNLMKKQSASLTGQIANLGDAWDMALNKIGERNQDVFSAGISGATYLVEHLDDILRIVKAITIAYGSYRAAIILNTLATKGYTGVALIDNTVRQAKIALLKMETVATNGVTKATKTLWATMKANPVGWIITLLGSAISLFSLFGKKEKEATDEQIGLANATKKASNEFSTQASKVDALQKTMREANLTYTERNKALLELKKIIPGYNAELTKEGKIINDNKVAIDKYLISLEKQIKLKAAQEELEELYRQKRLKEKTRKANEADVADAKRSLSAAEFSASLNSQKFSTSGMQSLSKGTDVATKSAKDNLNRANKALASTNKELKDIDDSIEELTTEINTVSASMDKSTDKVKSYTEQVDDARKKVGTLTKELEDLRSGKIENGNYAKAIEEKKNELNAAKKALEVLTNKEITGSNNLNEKQLKADRNLEEARISVMEEGYEKRKAILDLQHKKNLEQIDKEEKDLIEARKKAGKGGLSTSEKGGFAERRNLENQNYTKQQATLFDGEVDYKKKQYELYFRWVKNMGKEVADSHFSTLLQSGNSYKEYVENEIAKLQEKRKNGTITEGESNQLITLNMQYDEITGAKSAMDTFRESVTSTINQAATLAEKLEAVAQAKANLENGSSGLVGGDEQAAGLLFVTEEEEKIQKEIQEMVLNDFRSYEEQKKGIQDEYGVLRLEAMRMQDEERINQINKAESEALSALNASYLMQSESWKNLFTDLDSLTVDQIDKLITDIQNKMNTADLNLNPADMKAVLDKLDEAKKKILDVNPFKALGSAISSVFSKSEKGSKKSSKEIKTDWNNLAQATEGCFDFVNNAIDSCDVLGDLIGETGKSTINMVQGIATAGIAMSAAIKTAEKGSVILAAISIALQAIQWIAGLFNNDDKLEERIQNIQRNVDAISNSLDRLQHAYEQTYWVFTDEEKAAHDKRLQSIKDQIAALEQQKIVAQQSWDFVKYAQLTKQIKDLKYELEKTETNGDMFQLYQKQVELLEAKKKEIEKQIQAEKEKKKTDKDKIAEWEEAIKDIGTQLEDMERDMLETLAGTDIKSAIDDFASALVDAYCQGENAAKALGQVTKDVLKNAVVEALKRQFLAKAINDAVLYLGEAMEDGDLSDAEKKSFEDMVNKAGDKFYGALEAVGDWIKDEDVQDSTDPLTGAVTSMSEETGGVIAGRLNAFVINQSEQISIGREQLVYQAEIAANTRASATELTEIKETLKRIENKDNSLLSQGIS